MSRRNIALYWKKAEMAPEGVTAQVLVTDGTGSDSAAISLHTYRDYDGPRYRDYDGPRYRDRERYGDRGDRGYYRPNTGRFRTFNGCQNGWTVQDGVCKPYRGY